MQMLCVILRNAFERGGACALRVGRKFGVRCGVANGAKFSKAQHGVVW